jgi:hypothetical protein
VGHYCIHQAYIALLKRLQVLNQILFLLIGKPEIETGIVAVNDIQECLEAAIVIEAAFILREHKEPPFTYEDAREVHRLVCMTRRPVSFEAVDL